MFFVTLLMGFMCVGMILCTIDTYLPGFFIPIVLLGMRWMGIMLMWIGPLLYMIRSYQTGASAFMDIPSPGHTILINQGASSTKILQAKKDILNTLRHRGKRFKDMGEALRVAGHDVQISNETSYQTYPLWFIDLVGKYKKKYKVKNHDELMDLYKQLKNITDYKDLLDIEQLKPVISDEEQKKELFSMELDDIRNMAEGIYDGRTINIDAYKEWFENVTAYETETIINKTVDHRIGQFASYRFAGGTDWAKVVIPLGIILVLGAIAYSIFGGGG